MPWRGGVKVFKVVAKKTGDCIERTVYATTVNSKTNETMFLIHYVKWTWVKADDYLPLFT